MWPMPTTTPSASPWTITCLIRFDLVAVCIIFPRAVILPTGRDVWDRLIQEDLERGTVNATDMKIYQANNQLLDAELIMPHIMTAVSRASANDAWPGIAQFLGDPRVVAAAGYFGQWDFSTPTGLAEGYDPFENPFALSAPSADEINHSVAASIYSVWRSLAIQNTIDATLAGIDAAIGQDVMTANRPGSRFSINAFQNFLDTFETNQGYGVSGINFFTNPAAPSREDARDFLILASLQQALDKMAGDDFAAAFGNSTDLDDYRAGASYTALCSLIRWETHCRCPTDYLDCPQLMASEAWPAQVVIRCWMPHPTAPGQTAVMNSCLAPVLPGVLSRK